MLKFDAILPAGGRIDPAFAIKVGTENKALIRFGSQTILSRTVQVLRDTGQINRIIVIGTPEVRSDENLIEGVTYLSSGASGPENILNGLKYLLGTEEPPARVMVVTTDLPFLTVDVMHRFIAACPTDKDICVPLITKAEYEARFPDSSSTFIPLKDDTWTAGCAYMMDSGALQRSMPHIERVFANRKSKLGMAKLLGFGFLLKVITKSLTVPIAIKKVEAILACSAAGVLHCPPELAYDIDDLEDYEYAKSHMENAV